MATMISPMLNLSTLRNLNVLPSRNIYFFKFWPPSNNYHTICTHIHNLSTH